MQSYRTRIDDMTSLGYFQDGGSYGWHGIDKFNDPYSDDMKNALLMHWVETNTNQDYDDDIADDGDDMSASFEEMNDEFPEAFALSCWGDFLFSMYGYTYKKGKDNPSLAKDIADSLNVRKIARTKNIFETLTLGKAKFPVPEDAYDEVIELVQKYNFLVTYLPYGDPQRDMPCKEAILNSCKRALDRFVGCKRIWEHFFVQLHIGASVSFDTDVLLDPKKSIDLSLLREFGSFINVETPISAFIDDKIPIEDIIHDHSDKRK